MYSEIRHLNNRFFKNDFVDNRFSFLTVSRNRVIQLKLK